MNSVIVNKHSSVLQIPPIWTQFSACSPILLLPLYTGANIVALEEFSNPNPGDVIVIRWRRRAWLRRQCWREHHGPPSPTTSSTAVAAGGYIRRAPGTASEDSTAGEGERAWRYEAMMGPIYLCSYGRRSVATSVKLEKINNTVGCWL